MRDLRDTSWVMPISIFRATSSSLNRGRTHPRCSIADVVLIFNPAVTEGGSLCCSGNPVSGSRRGEDRGGDRMSATGAGESCEQAIEATPHLLKGMAHLCLKARSVQDVPTFVKAERCWFRRFSAGWDISLRCEQWSRSSGRMATL